MSVALQADYRTAAVALLSEFSFDAGIKLQVYRARPSGILPPTGFVDRMSDRLIDFLGPSIFQHVVTIQLVILHGLFDSGDTVDQRDRFVDAFLDWVRTRFHQAGGNTLLRVTTVDDDPTYIPEWLPEAKRLTYYATVITLEGEATD